MKDSRTVLLIVVLVAGLLQFKGWYHLQLSGPETIFITKHEYPQIVLPLMTEEKEALVRSWRWAKKIPVSVPGEPPEYILWSGQQRINIWRTARLACDNQEVIFNLPLEACRHLDTAIVRLENETAKRYGQLISWEEARVFFPMFSQAEIIDIETCLSFRVQRRGGTYHADVQPLTRQDTLIMKKIYGQWSWRKRSIIVVVGGQRMAASMNGMPHGAGAIVGNDFPGHFCIHFWGSMTHGSRKVDTVHQHRVLERSRKNLTYKSVSR